MKYIILKKIIISLFILIIGLLFFDIIIFHIDNTNRIKKIEEINKNLKKENQSNFLEHTKKKYTLLLDNYGIDDILTVYFRHPIIKNNNNGAIFIFGCSYAYGGPLSEYENFSANLAKNTDYSIYNFAYGGWGIQHFLALLENYAFSKIDKKPKYIIYVYMSDHIRRMYSKYYEYCDSAYFRYLMHKDKLHVDNINMPTLYMYRKFHILYNNKMAYNFKNKEKNLQNLMRYIERINYLIKQKFPDSRFIIFVYDNYPEYNWSRIKKMGITVIDKKDLCSNKQHDTRLADGHPTADAWKFYTPLFIKAANIK